MKLPLGEEIKPKGSVTRGARRCWGGHVGGGRAATSPSPFPSPRPCLTARPWLLELCNLSASLPSSTLALSLFLSRCFSLALALANLKHQLQQNVRTLPYPTLQSLVVDHVSFGAAACSVSCKHIAHHRLSSVYGGWGAGRGWAEGPAIGCGSGWVEWYWCCEDGFNICGVGWRVYTCWLQVDPGCCRHDLLELISRLGGNLRMQFEWAVGMCVFCDVIVVDVFCRFHCNMCSKAASHWSFCGVVPSSWMCRRWTCSELIRLWSSSWCCAVRTLSFWSCLTTPEHPANAKYNYSSQILIDCFSPTFLPFRLDQAVLTSVYMYTDRRVVV